MGILHKELSYSVIGCCMRVHNALGPGFPEAVYQKALGHELMKAGIPFEAQREFEVWYDGILCGKFRVDFFVDGKLLLEIKAVAELCQDFEDQCISYLKATSLELILLVNFGQSKLISKRLVHQPNRTRTIQEEKKGSFA